MKTDAFKCTVGVLIFVVIALTVGLMRSYKQIDGLNGRIEFLDADRKKQNEFDQAVYSIFQEMVKAKKESI